MSEAINFYGIDADRAVPLNDWTRSDLPWRAVWFVSDYTRLAEAEARKRVHVLALAFGTLTGAVWSTAAAYVLFGS
jgi:hypothetical protein